jgi:hypothetical protein
MRENSGLLQFSSHGIMYIWMSFLPPTKFAARLTWSAFWSIPTVEADLPKQFHDQNSSFSDVHLHYLKWVT